MPEPPHQHADCPRMEARGTNLHVHCTLIAGHGEDCVWGPPDRGDHKAFADTGWEHLRGHRSGI